MLHEIDFADVHGLVGVYSLVADLAGVQSCEIDLDLLRLSFHTRFPLPEGMRLALERTPGLVRVHSAVAVAPLFTLAEAVAAATRDEAQSAMESSTSMSGMPSSTG
jgi:hypothetical protein